jgi:glycosyltransferase involved in cell wall biosynthesis
VPVSLAPAAPQIAVVIPCYKVVAHVCDVIARIGPEVTRIYCVDDACPQGSGKHVEASCRDPRVRVLFNAKNLGVGGATLAGFARAAAEGAEIVVKVDGDGQMDPALLPRFVAPIQAGRADYAKGNRFYNPSSLRGMPLHRMFGNAVLSFMTKLSSGYWDIFDPTNGYVAIHRTALAALRLEKVSKRYFFESDMLYHLNIVRAVVEDVPMDAVYGDEKTNLVARRIVFEFLAKHVRNLVRRLVYNYYLRDFTIGSIEILVGASLLVFGLAFGASRWVHSIVTGVTVSAGTAMLAALPVILGLQLLLSFLASDIRSMPRVPLHVRYAPAGPPGPGGRALVTDPV